MVEVKKSLSNNISPDCISAPEFAAFDNHYYDVIMSAIASQISHQRLYCLHKRLFRRRSKITSKLRVTGLCAGNSPGTGEFPAQKASNEENVSIWWRHHDTDKASATKRTAGFILCMRPANERRRYIITSSLISLPHAQNDPCGGRWMMCWGENYN